MQDVSGTITAGPLLLSTAALALVAIVWLWRVAAQHDRDAAVGRWMRGGK